MIEERSPTPRHYLRAYCLWGSAASVLFCALIILAMLTVRSATLNFPLLAVSLLCGFAWIGATSFSRHMFVKTMESMGKEASMAEFLMTQLSVPFFPLLYQRLQQRVIESEKGGDSRGL